MQFIDRHFAHRLEMTDAQGGVAFARAYAELFPESQATAAAFAGGWATFAGVDSPLTQAFALGLSAPVEEAEIERMEDFFHSRGAAAYVELCPYADPSIIEIFQRRGYTLIEFSNVLVRRLAPEDTQLAADESVRVRRAEAHEARLWAETVARGFFTEGELPQSLLDLMGASFHSTAGTHFLSEIDGQVAGGGGLVMHDRIASLGGASTLPAFRNRGGQTALLRARIRFAAERGCEIIMVTTLPGTASQRNVERQGFRVVYTRSKLVKHAGGR
ncbi:MAG TPA: GNAT family N-acetyltransferase [Blastocatellia bacterium]|nr:GNAT family N-acetyltransferase [Blastocatellia bacterium]